MILTIMFNSFRPRFAIPACLLVLLAPRAGLAVTLEELHQLILEQQSQISEQAKKIEQLQRDLEDARREGAAPSGAAAVPAPAGVPTTVPEEAVPATAGPTPAGAPPAPMPPEGAPQPSAPAESESIARITRFLDRFSLSSYGVMNYYHYDWDTDPDARDQVDFERLVLGAEFRVTDTIKVEGEIEFEHLGTGSTMEFDKFEEFGEFETEIEKGGEVVVEELVLEYEPREWFGVKVGYFPIAIGLNNFRHRPGQYFTTTRFESETTLLPEIWTEGGVEAFGHVDVPRAGRLTYRLAGVNGLDSTGFSSGNWISNGHQTRFERINAEDWAVVARLDYEPIEGLLIGASAYHGDSADNRPKPDLDVNANVTIWDVHGEYYRGPLEIRGLYLSGHLENSAAVSLANAQLSNNLDVKRTPVAEDAFAWFIEAGIHPDAVTRYWLRGLVPFYRYDRYDTMDEVQAPVIRNPFYDRETHTVGLNYRPLDWLVLKGQYSHRTRDIATNNEEDTVSVGLGYDFGH
jgi:hypothetical protein